MSRSVRRTEVLPVPVCPTVLCHMVDKIDICPLGENSAPAKHSRDVTPVYPVVLWSNTLMLLPKGAIYFGVE